MDVTFIGAMIAGLLSFLSPCVLPLVPPYLCFLGGTTFDQLTGEDETPSHVYKTVVLSAIAFVLGFTTVFVTLGATATAAGQLLLANLPILSKIAGVIIIIAGLHFLGVIHLPFHARFPWSAKRWNFVLTRMNALCDAFFVGDLEQAHLWLNGVDIAASEATLNPGYRKALQHARVQLADPPRALPEPGTQCASYHAWLKALMRLAPELFDRSLEDQLVRLRHAENARVCSP